MQKIGKWGKMTKFRLIFRTSRYCYVTVDLLLTELYLALLKLVLKS